MATIPLHIAQRRLDTGTVAQYPQGSPIGGAMQGLGDQLSAVAERYQQMKDQQEAFDAELARRRFNGRIAEAEDEVTANAPADGAGLHEAMYGQVDPRIGRVVKTGQFDTLFADALPGMPESQRAGFARQKEAMRAVGARRMAQRQLQRRKDYEQTEVDTALKTSAIAIGNANPDDTISFEAARQDGLDLIDKMGLDPGIRQQKLKDWFSTAAKMRFEALIAKDPERALAMFGVETPGEPSGSDAFGVQPVRWIRVSDSSDAAAAKGDRVVDALTYLKPGDIETLRDKANTATAAQLVDSRAKVQLAEQNAPAVIASTGKYPETKPSEQDFVNIYGAEEGARHFQTFNITSGVAGAVFDIRGAPNQAIHAELRDIEPVANGSQEQRERYEIKAGAAQLVLSARRADPADYVSQMFPGQAPDWSKVSTPEDFQAAVTWATAAQQHLGFDNKLPLPWAVADQQAAKYIDQSVPFDKRFAALSSIVLAVRNPDARNAMADQIWRAAQAQWRASAAQDPNVTPELLEAQLAALKNGLAWIGEHPARAQYSTMPWLQQFGLALSDVGRLTAQGGTAGGADAISAGLDSALSGGNYQDLLKNAQAETEDAADRAGLAGWAAEALGAGLTGYGLAKSLFSVLGRAGVGVSAESGLIGLAAGTGVGGAVGGAYGGAYAYNTGESVPWGIANGALWGAGGNVLAEGLSAVGSQVVARLAGRSSIAKPNIAPDSGAFPVSTVKAEQIPISTGGADEIRRPYAHLEDPPNVAPGKKPTNKQRITIRDENMRMNGGFFISDDTGLDLILSKQSKKGVVPPKNEAHIDHIDPVNPADKTKKPGSNSYKNLRLIARSENREKSNK